MDWCIGGRDITEIMLKNGIKHHTIKEKTGKGRSPSCEPVSLCYMLFEIRTSLKLCYSLGKQFQRQYRNGFTPLP